MIINLSYGVGDRVIFENEMGSKGPGVVEEIHVRVRPDCYYINPTKTDFGDMQLDYAYTVRRIFNTLYGITFGSSERVDERKIESLVFGTGKRTVVISPAFELGECVEYVNDYWEKDRGIITQINLIVSGNTKFATYGIRSVDSYSERCLDEYRLIRIKE